MSKSKQAQGSSALWAIVILTSLMFMANLLSDIALYWPETLKEWVQFLAARASASILTFVTLWALINPQISQMLEKLRKEPGTRDEPESASTQKVTVSQSLQTIVAAVACLLPGQVRC